MNYESMKNAQKTPLLQDDRLQEIRTFYHEVFVNI